MPAYHSLASPRPPGLSFISLSHTHALAAAARRKGPSSFRPLEISLRGEANTQVSACAPPGAYQPQLLYPSSLPFCQHSVRLDKRGRCQVSVSLLSASHVPPCRWTTSRHSRRRGVGLACPHVRQARPSTLRVAHQAMRAPTTAAETRTAPWEGETRTAPQSMTIMQAFPSEHIFCTSESKSLGDGPFKRLVCASCVHTH